MLESVKPELKQCSRCHSTITLDHFETNRKGEFFKTCNNCRTKRTKYQQTYNEQNKERVQQYRAEYSKEYREKHKVELKEYEKNRNAQLRELHKQWIKDHPEEYKAQCEAIREQSRYYTITWDVPGSSRYIKIYDSIENKTVSKIYFDDINKDVILKEVEENLTKLRSSLNPQSPF